MELLVATLCDPCISISQMALNIIERAVEDTHCLNSMISHLSFIIHLNIGMESLIIKALSSVTGIQYLQDAQRLDQYIDEWATVK